MAAKHPQALRGALGRVLAALGILHASRRVRIWARLYAQAWFRHREKEYRRRFAVFRQQHGSVLQQSRVTARPVKTALVLSCRYPALEVELGIIKALQVAGFRPVVLIDDAWRVVSRYYELAGVDEIHLWSEFERDLPEFSRAAAVVGKSASLGELANFEEGGIRLGRFAVSTAMRRLRVGSFDLRNPDSSHVLVEKLTASMSAAAQAERILATIRPDLTVFVDNEYTPRGELFDACLQSGTDIVAYDRAHRSGALMFKRYGSGYGRQHLASLSSKSWALVQQVDWTPAKAERLESEIMTSYARGDWFSGDWIERQNRPSKPSEIRHALGLDPSRKTAVIFAHILWDAPLMWADMLFDTYEDWLVETVRAACANTQLNWIVKSHPANQSRDARAKHRSEPADVKALRQHLGPMPGHVVILAPETAISPPSLFEIMDYCLTVRGTVGLEAARLGIPVITGGASRYSHRGFTVDSETRQEYLERIGRLQDQPRMSAAQRELAERFAYGMFVLRPLRLQSVTWEPPSAQGVRANGLSSKPRARGRINVRAADEWEQAPDIAALASWLSQPLAEDFLSLADARS